MRSFRERRFTCVQNEPVRCDVIRWTLGPCEMGWYVLFVSEHQTEVEKVICEKKILYWSRGTQKEMR